ncbi:MAG: peptidoglycan editing factor PgeF [Succinivibrionaceae bacterium]|nr:peptidoglycan editing factor PgeF [Succinivibrionaceae bacterium]
MELIRPYWNVPDRIGSLCTTRDGGVSGGGYAGLNLGLHTGDREEDVLANRRLLQNAAGVVRVVYVRQIHETGVADADGIADGATVEADAVFTRTPGTAVAIMTADCLPVLLADADATVAAAAHAGWRGLCRGVLENTVDALGVEPSVLRAYLGPCIGPSSFEVGPEVIEAFLQADGNCACCFAPGKSGDRYLADLPRLARMRLRRAGIPDGSIFGGVFDTYAMPDLFYSYRREKICGRMASLVWIRRQN